MIARFIGLSVWFTRTSRSYIGPYTWRARCHFPIAWAKFMWLSRRDWWTAA